MSGMDGRLIRPCTDEEQAEFDRSVDEFFESLFDEVEAGDISLEQVGSVFPAEVRQRNP